MGICGECKCWKPLKDNTGECHCKAPLPYIKKDEEETRDNGTRWPLTHMNQSCGEFQKKSEKYFQAEIE